MDGIAYVGCWKMGGVLGADREGIEEAARCCSCSAAYASRASGLLLLRFRETLVRWCRMGVLSRVGGDRETALGVRCVEVP